MTGPKQCLSVTFPGHEPRADRPAPVVRDGFEIGPANHRKLAEAKARIEALRREGRPENDAELRELRRFAESYGAARDRAIEDFVQAPGKN